MSGAKIPEVRSVSKILTEQLIEAVLVDLKETDSKMSSTFVHYLRLLYSCWKRVGSWRGCRNIVDISCGIWA